MKKPGKTISQSQGTKLYTLTLTTQRLSTALPLKLRPSATHEGPWQNPYKTFTKRKAKHPWPFAGVKAKQLPGRHLGCIEHFAAEVVPCYWCQCLHIWARVRDTDHKEKHGGKSVSALMKCRIHFLESPLRLSMKQAIAGPWSWRALKCSASSVARAPVDSAWGRRAGLYLGTSHLLGTFWDVVWGGGYMMADQGADPSAGSGPCDCLRDFRPCLEQVCC